MYQKQRVFLNFKLGKEFHEIDENTIIDGQEVE